MVSKVHAGVYTDQVQTGSLRAFAIGGLTSDAAAATPGGVAGLIGESVGSDVAQNWILADGSIFPYDTNTGVPNTLADMIYRVLSTRATVVSIEYNTALEEMHVILENAAAWGYASVDGSNATIPSITNVEAMAGLVVELDKLIGLPVSAIAIDPVVVDGLPNVVGGGATVVEHDLVFGQPIVELLVDGVTVKTIGGLGGNEHDQDTASNATLAP